MFECEIISVSIKHVNMQTKKELKIKILSNYLKNIILKGDRCILLSENRPEWLISDIAIMNAGGVTVPLFTTYSKNDYEYLSLIHI